ncbi:MAG: hypothetical protein KatS3mg110_3555 [Pirellulaceae bacterium]|nr:MAG: hypothetical protein KatS3mg110_3555 [Pirellulaceae bacterium]
MAKKRAFAQSVLAVCLSGCLATMVPYVGRSECPWVVGQMCNDCVPTRLILPSRVSVPPSKYSIRIRGMALLAGL